MMGGGWYPPLIFVRSEEKMEETITWLFIGVVVVFIVTIACGFYVAYSICRQKRECVGEKKEQVF